MAKMTLEERLRRQKVSPRHRGLDRVRHKSRQIAHGIGDFFIKLPVRAYHSLDTLIGTASLGAVGALGAIEAGRYVFDPDASNRTEAIVITGAVIAGGLIGSYLARRPLGRAINKWFANKWYNIKDAASITKLNLAKTALVGILGAYAGFIANTDFPDLKYKIFNPPKSERKAESATSPPLPAIPVPRESAPSTPRQEAQNGIPPPIRAQIYWATNNAKSREELTRQILKFEQDYKKSAQKYYNIFLAKDSRLAFEDYVGLMMQESSMNPYAVSSMGAAGLTQIMPFTAVKYIPSCGDSRVYITNSLKEGLRTGKKEYFRQYAADLKKQLRKLPISKWGKFHAPLDAEVAICMGAIHLAFLERKYPQDSREVLLLKYNTRDSWVEFAKEIMGSESFEDISHFFREKESKEYPGKVGAHAHIYSKFKESGNKVQPPEFYLKGNGQQRTYYHKGTIA